MLLQEMSIQLHCSFFVIFESVSRAGLDLVPIFCCDMTLTLPPMLAHKVVFLCFTPTHDFVRRSRGSRADGTVRNVAQQIPVHVSYRDLRYSVS